MTERDPRWEEVTGFVGELTVDMLAAPPENFIRFEVAVHYDGQSHWSRIIAEKGEFEDFVGMYVYILDEIVKRLDERLDYWDKHHVHMPDSGSGSRND